MLDERELRKLKAGLLRVWIIWVAMFIALFIYFVVAMFLRNRPIPPHDAKTVELITWISYAGALVALVFAYVVRKVMLRRAAKRELATDTEHPLSIKSPYVAAYTPIVVVSLAIAESIGAVGLTIFFMNRDLGTLVALYMLSILGLFYYRPRADEAEKLAHAIAQRRGRE